MPQPRSLVLVPVLVLLAAAAALAAPPRAGFRASQGPAAHRFAQSLVNQMHAAHPEFSEIGISAEIPGHGCTVLASTDASDAGTPCETADMAPLKTGKAAVATEGNNLDVSLPLHDASGKLIGLIGIETAPGASRAATLAKVRAAVGTLEKQIPSQAKLIS